jgi:hypothetical protein
MRIIEFIFKLLFQFITFEPGRFSELKDKAFAWQKVQDEQRAVSVQEGKKLPWYQNIFKYDSEWWFQILLCFVFLFAFKEVRRWLMEDPLTARRDDDDDDDDGEDDVPKSKHKLALSSFKF